MAQEVVAAAVAVLAEQVRAWALLAAQRRLEEEQQQPAREQVRYGAARVRSWAAA